MVADACNVPGDSRSFLLIMIQYNLEFIIFYPFQTANVSNLPEAALDPPLHMTGHLTLVAGGGPAVLPAVVLPGGRTRRQVHAVPIHYRGLKGIHFMLQIISVTHD